MPGKKADNCGQAALPEAAGPWVCTDGYPFSPGIGELLAPDNVVYTPPWLDEFGEVSLFGFGATITGTDGAGELSDFSGTCEDWTSIELAPGPVIGSAGATSERWTADAVTGCGATAGLMCMERLPGPDLPEFIRPGRPAFVTSAAGSGELASWPEAQADTSGVEVGDSICRSLAADAGLLYADSFKAFLSDATTDAIDRFEHDGPWVRPDGVPMAANKAGLVSGTLFTAITVTESGSYLTSSDFYTVWTGTNPNGTRGDGHCDNWHTGSDAAQGRSGSFALANVWWTGGDATMPPRNCNNSYALYCLSDVNPTVFADRFEQP